MVIHFVTVTKHSGDTGPGERTRCGWCSRALPERPATAIGRKPIYCRRSCRQRAFEARRRGDSLGVSEDELIITRNELEDLNDRLFEISLAAKDSDTLLQDGVSPSKVLEQLVAAIDRAVGTN